MPQSAVSDKENYLEGYHEENNKMSGENDFNPIIIEIRERLAKVETRLDSADNILKDLKERVKSLDNRLWGVLITVILTIILTILKIIT